MKKLRYLILITTIAAWGIQSCNNPRSNNDTVSMAKEANEGKDTMDNMDTRSIGTEEFPTVTSMPYSDTDFAVESADAGMLEVQLGKLALTNSSNQEVKDFGQMMIDDHTKANNELTALAKNKDITLPPAPSEKSVNRIKDFNEKTGQEFDKDYINFMVSDHEKVVSSFENASNHTSDAEIKTFVDNTLPVLRNHLAAAKVLKNKL